MIIIGAGGGLIKPMQGRWGRMLDKAETESADVRAQAQAQHRLADRCAPDRAGRWDVTSATSRARESDRTSSP